MSKIARTYLLMYISVRVHYVSYIAIMIVMCAYNRALATNAQELKVSVKMPECQTVKD